MANYSRKFYKINGLHYIFEHENVGTEEAPIYLYNTGTDGLLDPIVLEEYGIKDINEHTILFITADSEDENRYISIVSQEIVTSEEENSEPQINQVIKFRIVSGGDTMIWARGNLYSVSTQCVKSIIVDEDRKIIITNSDGTTQTISQSQSGLGYSGIYPILVEDNEISLEGISIDRNGNFIENTDDNSILYGVTNSHVEGYKNQSTANYQHIQGKWAATDTSSIFIIGGGEAENKRYNLFVVDFGGTVFAKTDVTAGGNKNNPTYKLSDIHSVVESDWIFIS